MDRYINEQKEVLYRCIDTWVAAWKQNEDLRVYKT